MTGRYGDAFLDEVRTRTNLTDLIGRDVALRRRGREHWGLCPFHGEGSPSFSVNEGKGFAHCFGCGWHGDAFDWMRERFGLSFQEAVEELAVRAGMMADRDGRVRPKARPVARPDRGTLDRERQKIREWAWSVWGESRDAKGTLVETYLAARGIVLDAMPPTLRFHPGLRHSDTGLVLPAMVGCVEGPDAGFAGIHRTFLKADGSAKAAVANPKKMAGECFGGYLRLCSAEPEMCVAEGIETALSVMVATHRPIWAALSEGNLGAPLPPICRHVILCADNDTRDRETSERRLAQAAASHAARGCRVSIARPPEGMDFNDLLRAEGRRDPPLQGGCAPPASRENAAWREGETVGTGESA